MLKKMAFTATLLTLLSAGIVSAKQLITPAKSIGGCKGTCSTTVHCSGTCFCNLDGPAAGFCTQDPIEFKRATK